MELNYANEVSLFLHSALSGALVLLLFDLSSALTYGKRTSFLIIGLLDTVCILLASFLFIHILLKYGQGILRLYELCGGILGAILYKCTLSRLFSAVFRKIVQLFRAILKLFFKILLTPLQIAYKILYKSIRVLFSPIFLRFKHLLKRLFTYLRNARSLLRRKTEKL